MKRFHVNLMVSDLDRSKAYYNALFAAEPSVERSDYVKWMLDDPFINFSIEPAQGQVGIAHVGLQAADKEELTEVFTRVEAAGGPRFEEGRTNCCYALSEKMWTRDPDGIVWENFMTDGQTAEYGSTPELTNMASPDKDVSL